MHEPATGRNWNTSHGINWWVASYLFASPILAVGGIIAYLYFNGVHFLEPLQFFFFYFVTGMGITAGYHRFFAHKSHEAHPIIQLFYLIGGAAVIQQSALQWSNIHRFHHRYSDTELDPHNINQGFFYAHMGWILHKTDLSDDRSMVPDLMKNKYVMWQDKYYWLLVLIFGIALPTSIGALIGRPLGGFLWGFALRMVLQNHVIFSINSLAHTWGKQTFSTKFEARDSWLLAFISNGEGFHSFHHRFASDYRNGWRWFHWDPSKWFIGSMSLVGLTKNLKRTPKEKILAAQRQDLSDIAV